MKKFGGQRSGCISIKLLPIIRNGMILGEAARGSDTADSNLCPRRGLAQLYVSISGMDKLCSL